MEQEIKTWENLSASRRHDCYNGMEKMTKRETWKNLKSTIPLRQRSCFNCRYCFKDDNKCNICGANEESHSFRTGVDRFNYAMTPGSSWEQV